MNAEGQSARARTYEVIFGHETPAGKAFDVALIGLIVLSVGVVMLDSVASIRAEYGLGLRITEFAFTIIFTVEYLARLWCAPSAFGWRPS